MHRSTLVAARLPLVSPVATLLLRSERRVTGGRPRRLSLEYAHAARVRSDAAIDIECVRPRRLRGKGGGTEYRRSWRQDARSCPRSHWPACCRRRRTLLAHIRTILDLSRANLRFSAERISLCRSRHWRVVGHSVPMSGPDSPGPRRSGTPDGGVRKARRSKGRLQGHGLGLGQRPKNKAALRIVMYGIGALVALGWITAAISAGAYTARLNRASIWGFLTLVISPLPVFLLLLWVGPRDAGDDDWLSCPFCADAVKPGARRCPHCRSDLAPSDLIPTGDERR